MFFIRQLQREISIHPSFFGRDMEDRLKDELYSSMEGTCNGEYYIICVMDITNLSEGKVKLGRGEANFVIDYRAIVWKPFKGETVDCAVVNVKSQGLVCEVGPMNIFVSERQMAPDMKYNGTATPPNYSNNSGDTIEKGSAVRVQLMGLRSDVGSMFAIGKMKDNWFG
ncbi:DNA-directed RNA polymerase II subunit rpb7 [Cyphellophora attinorum]|uniref:DNA-directed RNA polymerase subunit n=1 Tax=Cyphellophora attinorum TaxID=1664694 RepID=A0A0N0NRW2_9EURO|nr:DNA-directed RNA polymerase II subunit rpb7 [Phialophora attinorum]KPI45299.1 DNA-directed RNA polymerase II subunit rpb7 [Phialophora attinorum]